MKYVVERKCGKCAYNAQGAKCDDMERFIRMNGEEIVEHGCTAYLPNLHRKGKGRRFTGMRKLNCRA